MSDMCYKRSAPRSAPPSNWHNPTGHTTWFQRCPMVEIRLWRQTTKIQPKSNHCWFYVGNLTPFQRCILVDFRFQHNFNQNPTKVVFRLKTWPNSNVVFWLISGCNGDNLNPTKVVFRLKTWRNSNVVFWLVSGCNMISTEIQPRLFLGWKPDPIPTLYFGWFQVEMGTT